MPWLPAGCFSPRARIFCVEGDEGNEAFILISGDAEVKITTPSGVATVARLKRNDIVGEMAILRDMPRTATVTAASDVTTLRIGKQDFLNLDAGVSGSGRGRHAVACRSPGADHERTGEHPGSQAGGGLIER